jgi:hypothetical protein
MTTEDDGREVRCLWWTGADGDCTMDAGNGRTLRLVATYHGDRNEFWIEELIDGKQVAIHNCRYIASITWA